MEAENETGVKCQELHDAIDKNVELRNDPDRLMQQFKLAIEALTRYSDDTYLVAKELSHGRPIPYWF